jgi:hypothetical protein
VVAAPDETQSKPRSVYCRLSALVRWTGWSEELIDSLARQNKIKSVHFTRGARKAARRYYDVKSVQELIDKLRNKSQDQRLTQSNNQQ